MPLEFNVPIDHKKISISQKDKSTPSTVNEEYVDNVVKHLLYLSQLGWSGAALNLELAGKNASANDLETYSKEFQNFIAQVRLKLRREEQSNYSSVHFTRPLKNRHNIVHSIGTSGTTKKFSAVETEFSVLSRLTIGTELKGYERLDFCGKYKWFDIIAVRTKREDEMAAIANRVDVDVICLDQLPNLHKARPQMGEAMRRGIYFELGYSNAILEKNDFSRFVRNMRQLIRVTHGKHLILSNGSNQAVDQRGPYDVANIAALLGLDNAIGIHMISTFCRKALLHGESRRTVKGVIKIRSKPQQKRKPLDTRETQGSSSEAEDIEMTNASNI